MLMMTSPAFNTSSTSNTPSTTNHLKGKKPYKSWLKDGVNGGPCSMDVLVNWLSKKANYAKWKGDECERIPKKSLLEDIIEEMRQVGIHHRLAKDVASKISTLQSNYRLAREWNETDGRKLLKTGASEESVHEELLKRFPYWDALDEVFSSWSMSISNLMHSSHPHHQQKAQIPPLIKKEPFEHSNDAYHFGKRKRKSVDLDINAKRSPMGGIPPPHRTPDRPSQSFPTLQQQQQQHHSPMIIRPLPRVLHSPIHKVIPPPPLPSPPSQQQQSLLAASLLQVTREKEAGRMKRSKEMLQFLREKRIERDQLLIEKELTKRVKAKAELVKSLLEAGFDKQAIAEQLNKL
ncbi:hypothetical protein BDF20DRAFT_970583 [Mycotypha africana]|uniref:uncharacterized protein n=1 Tax=Mycotypha africana TaxID=64632 RepID=UPI0023001C17|nr:uncharacterized protein BDF20DRAFT_970583 [Mycotypha africana]KAI8988361.1 hypothetical protein BDF20DRAFT_970583 [Mycotypha africana]